MGATRAADLTSEGLWLFGEHVDHTAATGILTQVPLDFMGLLNHASVAIREAVVGNTPRAWTSAGRPKGHRLTNGERNAIGYASAYFALADQDGIIPDINPTK